MATETVTTTYEDKKVLVNKLDIIDTYKELMEASTGQNSVYLRAKETLISIYEDSSLTDTEKASAVAQVLGTIATDLTGQAMEMAYKIEKENRDAVYVLTKLKEDTRLTSAQVKKLEQDIANADEDGKLKTMTGWKAQMELYRDYGVDVSDQTAYPDLLDDTLYQTYGTKVESIKMAQANVYNGYATAFRNNGLVTLVTNSNGELVTGTVGDTNGLNYWQSKVAERNEKGFDDNMRQHVANSSATLVNMLLASEEPALVDDASAALVKWGTAVDWLNGDETSTL